MHYEAHTEVYQQTASLQQTAAAVMAASPRIKTFFADAGYNEILFVGCGSSHWLSGSAAHTVGQLLKMRSTAVVAGDVVLNPHLYEIYSQPLLIVPSRSGNTTETLKAVDFFKQHYDCRVLAVVIYPDSALAATSDLTLELPWANEVSVCQTRSFNNLYAACVLAAALVADNRDLIAEIEAFAEAANALSARCGVTVRHLLSRWDDAPQVAVLAHGKLAGIGQEGAYIVLEMAQHAAHFFATLELRHGPMVLLNEDYLVLLISNGRHQKAEEKLLAEIASHGATAVVVSAEGYTGETAENIAMGKAAPEEVLGLFASTVTQVLAYELAVFKNLNPDAPKDLVRWIALNE